MAQPSKEYLDTLKKHFGHSEFRPLQWQIIHSIMEEKRDNCVVMATGYGKSLCYQFPPVHCQGLALVISPLISLMQDQVLSLQVCNIPACFLGSALSNKKSTLDDILAGKYRLVYVTPEWATGDNGKTFLENLKAKINLTLIAIDEAHCVSQWGFDFRKSYRNLKILRTALPGVPVLTVTATATPQVMQDICANLKLQNPSIVKTSFDRPNLFLSVSSKGNDPSSDIRSIILKQGRKPNGSFASTIVYCPTKKSAEKVCDSLSSSGLSCALYHADLSYRIRQEVHEDFVKDIVPIVVATIAFGMGIDKPDVRIVVHYGAPKEIESYYQEIGRAGRDGQPAYCHIFYSNGDFCTNKLLMGSLTGRYREHKEKMARIMENYLDTRNCRRKLLLTHFDPGVALTPNPNCCDNCIKSGNINDLNELYDLTEDTLLLLKGIEVFQGKYGLTLPICFLRGSTNKRLPLSYYKHELYGKGKSKPEAWWKSLGRLLLRENLLIEDRSNCGKGWNKNNFPVTTVSVSAKGQRYLVKGNGNGIVELEATKEMMSLVRPKNRLTKDAWLNGSLIEVDNVVTSEDPVDDKEKAQETEIYEKLMELRSDMAMKIDCMPYMICSNVALQEMAKKKPLETSQLAEYNGFTEGKIKKFGPQFISIIKKVTDQKLVCKERSSAIGKTFKKFRCVPDKPKISMTSHVSDWGSDEDDAASFATAIEDVENNLKSVSSNVQDKTILKAASDVTAPSSNKSFTTCDDNFEMLDKNIDNYNIDSPACLSNLDQSVWAEIDSEGVFQFFTDLDETSNLEKSNVDKTKQTVDDKKSNVDKTKQTVDDKKSNVDKTKQTVDDKISNLEKSSVDKTKQNVDDKISNVEKSKSVDQSLITAAETSPTSELSSSGILKVTEISLMPVNNKSTKTISSSLSNKAKVIKNDQKRTLQYDSDADESAIKSPPKRYRIENLVNTSSRKRFVKSKRLCI